VLDEDQFDLVAGERGSRLIGLIRICSVTRVIHAPVLAGNRGLMSSCPLSL
jgi:hypothetical protein